MSVYSRMERALDYNQAALKEIGRAEVHPDPVEQRRCLERAAEHWRRAAAEVDPDSERRA